VHDLRPQDLTHDPVMTEDEFKKLIEK